MLDLYHNRRFALRHSNYRWICRFDSDFVAYTDGENNILKLRKLLLNLPGGIIPKVILLKYISVDGDFWHFRTHGIISNRKRPIIDGPRMSIYEYFPFCTFFRFKRREFFTFQIFMKKIFIKTIHIMHCSVKSGINHFLRSERTNWRELGDFKKYPNLLSYIKDIIEEKYNTSNLKEAIDIFLKKEIYKEDKYIRYDPEKFMSYPSLIKEEMKKKEVFKIDKFLDK